MGNLGLSELLVIFIVALLVIGPKRLPEVARALGEAVRSFQDAMNPVRSARNQRLNRSREDKLRGTAKKASVQSEPIERGERIREG